MTNNQIQYYKATEEARHNLVEEDMARRVARETNRHNLAVEDETGRANLASEAIRRESNSINAQNNRIVSAETSRHNAAMEDLQRLNNQRVHEGNLVRSESNQISRELGYINAANTQRSIGVAGLSAQAANRQATAALQNAQANSARQGMQNFVDFTSLFPNVARTKAQTNLMQSQAQTEESKRFVNYVRGATSLVSPISMLVGGVK